MKKIIYIILVLLLCFSCTKEIDISIPNAGSKFVVNGIIEKGEKPIDVARREMIEETGLKVSQLTKIFHYLVSPGGSSESVFLYCGKVDSTNASGIFGMVGEHENIRVFSTSAREAFDLLDNGRITNAMTIIGLQWLQSNHDYVRSNWST